MHIANPQLKQELTPVKIAQDWDDILPPLVDNSNAAELEKTRSALKQAEQVIRAQEQRIRGLEKMALTDELTGLVNRRGFTNAFNRELSLVQRNVSACGVLLMVDLDGFKSINDQWGHQTGDDYLCAVAETLRSSVRGSDIVARLGGDEFAVLLTHIDEEDGRNRSEALEKKFNASFMTRLEAPHRVALRASFGLAFYTAGDKAERVMEMADSRLYAHKIVNKQKRALPKTGETLGFAGFLPFI